MDVDFNQAKAGILLDAAGLYLSSTGARISVSADGKKTVVEGPFTESKELVAGYWLIQVKSIEEAIEWAKRAPHGPGQESEIEVRQFIEFEGQEKHVELNLEGINLLDGKVYRISMYPDGKRTAVVPESFQIILRQYLGHPEAKSLAPDGTECIGDTTGLLKRTPIVAGEIVPIGKETDRHWEQGEDPSMVDFKVAEFRKSSKLVIAEASDRKRWRVGGVRVAIRKSGLSPTTVYAILDGRPVRRLTLATFKRAVDG